MTTTIATAPDLCIEVHRYDKPENRFRFFYLEPKEQDESGLLWIQHPFRRVEDGERVEGPGYHEHRKMEVLDALAEHTRSELLAQGYKPFTLEECGFAHWVIHSHAPIEWHRALDAEDPVWTSRVTVWIRT